jgi:hypothetical protein
VVTTWTGRSNRFISNEEQRLYDHLLYWVEHESPSQLVERFYNLFIDGTHYQDLEVANALDAVTSAKTAPDDFRFVLNRCCHILINRWQSRPSSQVAIPQLIKLFESIPDTGTVGIYRSRSVKRLRELVTLFTETEQYLTLCRLSQVLTQTIEATASEQRPLGSLIRRYPYLYEHCLLSEDSTIEQQRTVKTIQTTVQRQFEIDLSQYVTYQVRQSQVKQSGSDRLITPVVNPTLLPDLELCQAIKHYVGRVDGSSTYRDIAHNFSARSGKAVSYGTFKRELYDYITGAIDPDYGRRQFNLQLCNQLEATFPESDALMVNDFLMVRTCSHLLNFLVVDKPNQPNHFIFIDLLTNLGPTLTTGLLLRIVLFCRKVRTYLERRFSILFSHYEDQSREVVQWLINALEHLNVALTVNFGAVDLPLIR